MDAKLSQDPKKAGDRAVGKLRASGTAGTSYTLYDAGVKPQKSERGSKPRKQLGVVDFLYGAVGPGHFRVAVPTVNEAGVAREFKEIPVSSSATVVHEGAADLHAAALAHDRSSVIELGNKTPEWDEATKAHQLRFGGRVKLASTKNFQAALVQPTESTVTQKDWKGAGGPVVLQFGRVARDRFIMDVSYPLSIFQGFAITIATLDPKLAENAGYEKLRSHRNDGMFGSGSAR